MSTSAPPQKLLVLLSGSGTNFAALVAATQPGGVLHNVATITHVISNRKSAYGLVRAAEASIPSTYHNLVPYKAANPDNINSARASYDSELARLIVSHSPDVVVCAGWMHILSPAALDPVAAAGIEMINLHPALPGQFDGIDAIRRAHEAFAKGEIKETGLMVHRVIHAVDRGEPIVVRKVEMREGESLDDLEARIHKVEHEAIVEGTRLVLEERRARKEAENK
ncbi:formyl transferase [Geopyxis carbonaria]|nr:formyl transferase [Geopyxis carbonaria]